MSKEDIVHKKWLSVKLTMVSSAGYLVKSKIRMKEYAEELGGWEVIVDKEGEVSENGQRLYETKAVPNKTGKISPEEFRILKDKLLGFSLDLLVSLKPDKEEQGIVFWDSPLLFIGAKNSDEVTFLLDFCNTLLIEYKINDRLELEKKDINLAKVIFINTFKEQMQKMDLKTGFFSKISQGEEIIKNRVEFKKRLNELFDLNVK